MGLGSASRSISTSNLTENSLFSLFTFYLHFFIRFHTAPIDKHKEVVTWAAAAALKNLALEPTAKPLVEEALHCMCVSKDSSDWLEEAKAFDLLHHMRRNPDPCWVRDDGLAVCIDDNFLDGGLFHCDEYDENSDMETCRGGVDKFSGKTAADSCCACGGGSQLEFDEHDEL